MKRIDRWQPTKYARRHGRLTVGPTANPQSWLVTRIVAAAYDRHLGEWARGRLADLGCGAVPLYLAYRDRVDEVVCVDWRGGGGGHLDLQQDLNAPLGLADRAFDTVLLSDVLEHIYRPSELLGEIRRILAPRGKLILNVPFLYWLHEEPHDHFRYTEHALRRLCEDAGLEVLLLEPLGSGLDVLTDVVAKHVAPIPMVGGSVARLAQKLAWVVGSRISARSRLLALSRRRFPLGYFLVAGPRPDGD